MGSFRYTLERLSVCSAALPYYQTSQSYGILTNTLLYTSLEIFAYPFDELTWAFLLGSLIFGQIITYIVTEWYDYFLVIRIGIGYPPVKNTSLNICRLILGHPILQNLNTDFSRFVILSWHIYGTLFRTAYQSLIFKIAKLNVYHEPPQTLKDLINNECTLVMTELIYDSVRSLPGIAEGLIPIIKLYNTSEQRSFSYVEEYSDKNCLVSVSPTDFLTYYAYKENKRGIFYILPENIFVHYITMYFTKHSFLISHINEFLMNLRSMGLVDFWAQQSLNKMDNKMESVVEAIKVQDLEGIFFICCILHFIAICIFLLEIIISKIEIFVKGKRFKFVK